MEPNRTWKLRRLSTQFTQCYISSDNTRPHPTTQVPRLISATTTRPPGLRQQLHRHVLQQLAGGGGELPTPPTPRLTTTATHSRRLLPAVVLILVRLSMQHLRGRQRRRRRRPRWSTVHWRRGGTGGRREVVLCAHVGRWPVGRATGRRRRQALGQCTGLGRR